MRVKNVCGEKGVVEGEVTGRCHLLMRKKRTVYQVCVGAEGLPLTRGGGYRWLCGSWYVERATAVRYSRALGGTVCARLVARLGGRALLEPGMVIFDINISE